MKNSHLLKRFLPYYKPHIGTLILDLFCATLTIVSEMFFPLIIQYITDTAINDFAKLTVSAVLIAGGLYIALRLIAILANYYMQYVGHMMGAKIETNMRSDMFLHLEKQSFTYYNNTKIGQIMSRITTDLFDITEFAHHGPEEFFIAGLKIVVSFCILSTFNIWLTLLIFCLIPIMLVCTGIFNKRMRRAFKAQRKQLGEINAGVEDSLLGIRVVKSFANEDIEIDKFENGNLKFLGNKRDAYKTMAEFHSMTRLFDALMYITVIIAGALFLINGLISVGEYTAYLLFVTTLLASVRQIVEFMEQFQRGMTGIERFYEVIDSDIEISDRPNAIDVGKAEGHIVFDNVTFNYNENQADVLKNINIDIKKGENLAIIGPSGGGKSTLCNLLPRFYEVEQGAIYLDNININDITLYSLRKNIGIVQQDIYLFSGTIYENIAYGKPDTTKEEVIQAAIDAGADEFIKEFPNGYDTYVGERGVKLSGGQKQRISIARVFLKNPPILILDEATSALDNESERYIQKSLEKLSFGRTTITIAHRLSTIKNADRILVLTKDGIVECGTHEELLKLKGMYYDMLNA